MPRSGALRPSIGVMPNADDRLHLGIVANEFFEPTIGRMGGFGWAARQVARFFRTHPTLGVDVSFISRELRAGPSSADLTVHGSRLIPMSEKLLSYARMLRRERFDLLLTIDYRPSYQRLLLLLPFTPVIVWVRDPRTPEDAARVAGIRIPGQPDVQPRGLRSPCCTSLSSLATLSAWLHRPLMLATTSPFLRSKIEGAYNIRTKDSMLLPNIIDLDPVDSGKSPTPRVAFLGRLDPYKRPWLFAKLARQFPQVEFLFLGQAHFRGPGAWRPDNLADNIHMLEHVGEVEKRRILTSAWVLVNTSHHEGLAVSLLEALACETPLLASVDPERVVSRFGIYVGDWSGTGEEGLPHFVAGLSRLLEDKALRLGLGKRGRAWVQRVHSAQEFVSAFGALCSRAGVSWNGVGR